MFRASYSAGVYSGGPLPPQLFETLGTLGHSPFLSVVCGGEIGGGSGWVWIPAKRLRNPRPGPLWCGASLQIIARAERGTLGQSPPAPDCF